MIRTIVQSVDSVDALLCRKVSLVTGKRFLDRSMLYISASGDGYLYGVAAVLALLIDVPTGLKFLFAGSIAFAFELALQKLVKHIVKRERPGIRVRGIRFLVEPPDRFSFPSGHTAGAFLISVLLVFFYGLAPAPLYIWSSLVGFSRVYNGVHYPTDILFGCVLGISSAFLGIQVVM